MFVSKKGFFEAKLVNVSPKVPLCLMEFPFFSINVNRKNINVSEWYDENRKLQVRIKPTSNGQMTILDLDVLIFITSQLMAAKNDQIPVSKNIIFHANTFHEMTKNKGVNGPSQNKQLFLSLQRLSSTRIETNIEVNGYIENSGFNLISYNIVRNKSTKRMLHIEIKLSDWLFNSIAKKSVRTIENEYFKIKSPLLRRLYLLVDQHLYKSKVWTIGARKLHKKVGGKSEYKKFIYVLKNAGKVINIQFDINEQKKFVFRRRYNCL